jgi:hypothetical protein
MTSPSPARAPLLHEVPKPRFAPFSMRFTSGKRARTIAAVPSAEALSERCTV